MIHVSMIINSNPDSAAVEGALPGPLTRFTLAGPRQSLLLSGLSALNATPPVSDPAYLSTLQ
jgi:hypothetical protein